MMFSECNLPPNPFSKNSTTETLLLAVITTCDTDGCDAMMEPTYFKSVNSYIEIMDLRAICAVVGCIKVGTIDLQWGVINRSSSWARTVFMDNLLTAEASEVLDL